MFPELFQLPFVNITLRSYGPMIVVGFLLGLLLVRKLARAIDEDPDHITNLALYALIAGVVGARALYVIYHFAQFRYNLASIFAVWQGGLIFLGGVPAAIIIVIIYLLRHKLAVRRYMDILAVGLMLGLAFGRIGCFLKGCCYGIKTNLPWGVNFGDGILRHPTQLYESFFMFGMFFFLLFKRKNAKPGYLFYLLMNSYFIFRFFIEFIRDNPHYLGLTLFQYLSIGALIFINAKYLKEKKSNKLDDNARLLHNNK